MANKTVNVLLALVVLFMGALLVYNSQLLVTTSTPPKYLSRGDVRGMATTTNGKEYTLNFSQQTRVIDLLNHSIKIGLEGFLMGESGEFDYDALTIYLFDGKEIVIKPVGFMNHQLVFQAQAFHPEGLLRETGPGELHQILSETIEENP